MGMTCRVSLFFSIWAIAHVVAYSQQRRPLVLNYADSLVGRTVGGESVRVASGRVEFQHGNVIVRCDQATQFLQSNKAVLIGKVKVTREQVTVMADRGVYYGNERRMDSEGNVRLQDDGVLLLADFGSYYPDEKRARFWQNVAVYDTSSLIQADELTYYEGEGRSIAQGNVRLIDDKNHTVILGQKLEHEDARGYTRVSELPRLLQIDTTSAGTVDTLIVTSRVMESFVDSTRRYIATDSVALVRGDLASMSQKTTFYPEEDRITLRGEPTMWYDRTQVSGDSIDIILRDGKAHHVVVMGRAFAISMSNTLYPRRFDQLSGEAMTMTFSDDRIQRIEVNTTATSLYFLYDEGRPNGVNRSSGDSIILTFADGDVNEIKVTGGVQGQYYPENMVAERELEYNLTGFHWKEERPKKRL